MQEDDVHATQEERVHEDIHGDASMMSTFEVLHAIQKFLKIFIWCTPTFNFNLLKLNLNVLIYICMQVFAVCPSGGERARGHAYSG